MSDPIIQGSDAWKQLRLGRVTASRIADLMAKTKSGPSASRANYAAQLVCERLTGTVEESYSSAAMQRGSEVEAEAREFYEFSTDQNLEQVGFVQHPTIEMAGASPDVLVGEVGLAEFKCPNSATHIETLMGQAPPRKYLYQVQWQLSCTRRLWCDWVSYDPRLPADMKKFQVRIQRDDTLIKELEAEVVTFLAEVDAKISALTALYRGS